jgi:3-oxoadipate enol-lactonase
MPTASVAGFDIFFETYGHEANPALFMVHGLYFDHYSMATLAERLSDSYFVVTPDAIGHGKSSKPDQFTLADQGSALVGLISHLGCRAVTLLGEAMGSYVALEAARLAPRAVRRLILLATKSHGMTSSMREFFQVRNIDTAAMTFEEMLAALDSALWCPETLPERRQQIMRDVRPSFELSRNQLAIANASLVDFDLRDDLPAIQAQTLVCAGAYDGLNPPDRGREVAALIPGARFELFEHSGHMLKYEEQVKTGDVVRQFLGG